MDRNKYIYSLSDFGVVVRSDLEKGGTWSGATECIEKNYCALFVLDLGKEERGNAKLIDMRGIPLDIDMISREPDIYRLLSGMIERDSEEEPFIGQNVKQLPLWF
jgi:predicted Rossmann fold nucleotide-binding protein DprA/Smf involved in DNA uptake